MCMKTLIEMKSLTVASFDNIPFILWLTFRLMFQGMFNYEDNECGPLHARLSDVHGGGHYSNDLASFLPCLLQ
jgi:hypothetical protein